MKESLCKASLDQLGPGEAGLLVGDRTRRFMRVVLRQVSVNVENRLFQGGEVVKPVLVDTDILSMFFKAFLLQIL